MIKDIIKQAIHEELLDQIEGLLNIELGEYIYAIKELNIYSVDFSKNDDLRLWISRAGNGLDIYLMDSHYVDFDDRLEKIEFKENDECGFVPRQRFPVGNRFAYFGDATDWCMIGHYHSDDLLFLILNWKTEAKQMKHEIDRIFNDYFIQCGVVCQRESEGKNEH